VKGKTLGTQTGKDRSVDRVYPSQDGSCGHWAVSELFFVHGATKR